MNLTGDEKGIFLIEKLEEDGEGNRGNKSDVRYSRFPHQLGELSNKDSTIFLIDVKLTLRNLRASVTYERHWQYRHR